MEATSEKNLQALAMQFVEKLAADLATDDLELPGFPDNIMRLQRELTDESKSVRDIVNRINTEPALAAKLIKLANSAAFNPAGAEVCDPQTAVRNVGFNVVSSTATSYAIKQMSMQEWLAPVRSELEKIWLKSNNVASICAAVARQIRGLSPDEYFAAGLFHQVGKLYLLSRAHQENLVAGNPDWEAVVSGWHPTIARAIMENWGMPEHVAVAAESQDALEEDDGYGLDLLVRVLAAAKLYDELTDDHPERRKIEKKLAAVALTKETGSFIDTAVRCQDEILDIRMTIS